MAKFEGTRKVLEGASAGIAVAVAFLNVALILVKLVQTVTEESAVLEGDGDSGQIEQSE